MLNHAAESDEKERPDYRRLVDRLVQDSRDWAEAELALARIELAELKESLMRVALFAALAFAAALSALLAFTEAAIAALAPHLGAAYAGAMVALVLGLVVAACGLALRRQLTWRRESIFFRWFATRAPPGPRKGDPP